jgi:DNA-binding CsgD family transcriptional regulator
VTGAREPIGREPELAVVAAFLDDVAAGAEARSLILEGEAGIGKTILWRAGVEDARARGVRVLACAPGNEETRLSFSALSDLLAGVADEVANEVPPPQRRALAVALLLAGPDGEPPDQRTVGAATLSTLRALARAGPVLLAIDDVQWLDEPSAACLAFAARRFDDDAVSVLATHRLEPVGDGDPAVLVALGRRPGHRLERRAVDPLTLTALHELVQSRLGLVFPRVVLQRIHETSGGNPFYAIELARALAQRPHEPGQDQLPVPDTLLGLVRERLDGLAEPVRRLLSVVAALSDATLVRVRAAGVGKAVDSAILAGVLELQDERLRFTHPLLASAVVAALGPDERRALHRRLAEVVDDPEERAGHLALGADGPAEDVAAALHEAALRAAARGAIAPAARFANEAVRLTPPGREAELAVRRLDASGYEIRNGDTAAGLAHVEPLVDALPPGSLHAAALLRLARLAEMTTARAIELCRQAIVEADDDRLRAEGHRLVAELFMHAGDVPAALEHARAAAALAETAEDPALLIESLGTLCHYETYTASVTPGLLERAVELERGALRPSNNYSPREILGLRLMYADRLDEARELLEESYDAALAIGDELDRGSLLVHLTQLECRAGRLARALDHARECTACLVQADVEPAVASFPTALAAAHSGRAAEARKAAETGLADAENGSELFRLLNLWALGFLELSLGDVGAADRCLSELSAAFRAMGYRNPGVRPVYADAIEARIQAGDLDCVEAIDELEAAGRDLDYPWALATAARCRGLLSAARGELDAAAAQLERALREHDRCLQPFELGRTLLALGVVQRRAKQRAAARATLDRALQLFDGLGAALWAEKAAAELARIPGRGRASGDLTETERRVAELVAEGFSNKEVAARLFVSVRAVEANLSKVYAKLGIRSRTELASRLARPSDA